MMGKKRFLRTLLLGSLFALLVLFSTVTAHAAKIESKTMKKGQIYYIMDTDIRGHGITANQFSVTPKTSSSRYDLIFAYSTGGQVSVRMAVNLGSTFTSTATGAYIKSSAGSNTGALMGIHVRAGSVVVKVATQNAANTFTLSLVNVKSSQTPLRTKTVSKGKKIQFQIKQGNTPYLPLIFGGTKGTKIKRPLSSTKYELYIFQAAYLEKRIYLNKKLNSTTQLKYNSTYPYSGKNYLCTLMQVVPSSSSKSSGWMEVTKGKGCFLYPREFLGVVYTMK